MRYLLTIFLFVFTCFGKFFAMNPAPVCGDGVVDKFFEEARNYDAAPVGCFCCNRLAKEEKKYAKPTREMETPLETLNTPVGDGVEDITVLKKNHHFSDNPSHKILVVWESKDCRCEDFFIGLSFDFTEYKSPSKESRHFVAKVDNYNCEFIFLPVSSFNLCSFYQNKVDVVLDCFDYLHYYRDKMGFYNDCQKKFDLADLFIKGKSTKTPLVLFGLWHPENTFACCAFNSVRHCFGEKLSKEELSFVDYGVDKDWLKTKLIDLLSKSSCH